MSSEGSAHVGATCSHGHVSEWDDYCSVCGEAMGPAGADPEVSEAVAQSESSAPAAATTCPNCSEATGAGDIFCENCGYDFLSGTLPDASTPAVPGPAGAAVSWVAVVSVDLDFFERMQFAGVDPPSVTPEPVRISLPPTDILVGRHSESRGTFPEIDLGGVFGDGDAADPAVSSSHCRLHRNVDGWTVTDLGSTNGTFLADAVDPITPGAPEPLEHGSAIHVGAWTRIELVEAT